MTAVFVDRRESLDVLASVAGALAEGRSSVLVIEGDSGMGKSALLQAFAERTTPSCRVVLVRCTPGIGARRSYGPVFDALDVLVRRSGARSPRRSRWARAMGRGAMAAAPDLLSAAVPGLGALFAAGRGFAEAAVSTGSIPGDSLQPVESAMTRQLVDVVLEQAGEGEPLMILIDDIQLCDVASLELFHLLLPRLQGAPLSLVFGLSSHAAMVGNGPAVRDLLHSWRHSYPDLVARHRLEPLPEWAVRELVDSRLDGHNVPHDFAVQLAGATAGRPLFVEQCLRLWRPGCGAQVPLPDSLPTAVRERFQRLDARARELLLVGATMGEFFFSTVLAEVTAVPQIQVQDILHDIEHEHGLIRERRGDAVPRWAKGLFLDWYDFDHRVLQNGIRGEQSEGARLRRHADIAAALRGLPATAAGTPRELKVMIADQLRDAGPACAAQSAAAAYELARSVAVNELSFAQAEQHCHNAIESARMLSVGDPDRDRLLVDAVELLLSLTEVRWKGSRATGGGTTIDSLAAEAEEAALRLGDGLMIARTTLLRGKTLLAVDGLGPSLDKLEQAVARARDCAESGKSALFIALVEYGRQLPKRDLHAGLSVLLEAEQLYAFDPQLGETGNPVLQHARNLNEMQIGVNLFDAGRFGEAQQRLMRCVHRLRNEALHAELPIALNYLAQIHLAMGADGEARAVLHEALEFEEDRGGDSGWHAYNNALLALLGSREPGCAGEAVRRASDAWAETQRTWLANLVPLVRNLYAEVLVATGQDTERALRLAEDTLIETQDTGMVRSEIAAYCLRSRIRLSLGDTDSAARDARQALGLLAEYGDMPALRTEEVLYHAARALTAAGDAVPAGPLLERARGEVLRKADSIDDGHQRARFLTAVPLNRALFPAQDPGPT